MTELKFKKILAGSLAAITAASVIIMGLLMS